MPISPQMTAFDMREQHLYSGLLISPMLSAATLQSKLTLVAFKSPGGLHVPVIQEFVLSGEITPGKVSQSKLRGNQSKSNKNKCQFSQTCQDL